MGTNLLLPLTINVSIYLFMMMKYYLLLKLKDAFEHDLYTFWTMPFTVTIIAHMEAHGRKSEY